MADITTKVGRRKLESDGQIYYAKVATGQHVGFRRTGADEGTWWARRTVEGKRTYHKVGDLPGVPPGEAWDRACDAAREWFRLADGGGHAALDTVADACRAYVNSLAADKRAEAQARIKRTVLGTTLANVRLTKLRPTHLRTWRKGLAEPRAVRVGKGKRTREQVRSAATINRDLVPVRAALRAALGEAGAGIWRDALLSEAGVGGKRERVLSAAERSKLIEHVDDAIKPQLRFLSLVPLRPGAAAMLTVGDWKGGRLTVRKDKAGAGRSFTVAGAAAALLTEQAKNKLPSAYLFPDPTGNVWDRFAWRDRIVAAVKSAGLPGDVTAYTLRHSLLTELAASGAPLAVVAKIAGTSMVMIERSYYHGDADAEAAALAGLAL